MEKCLLYLLTFVVLAPNCIRGSTSITVLRDLGDDMVDLSYQHIHLDLRKAKQSNDFEINSAQRNCSQKFLEFWNNLNNNTREAYFDSFGEIGAGILSGNTIFLGYYDQCIDIGNTDYCRFPFDVTLTTNTTVPSNTSVTIPLELGMCFPSSCDANDFYNLFLIDSNEVLYTKSFTANVNAMIHTINVKAPSEYREPVCPLRELKWTSSSIVVLTACVLLISLVIMGTMVDVSMWLVDDVLPKFYIAEMDPSEQTKSPLCEVKHSINEDEPLINGKPITNACGKPIINGINKPLINDKYIVKTSQQHVAKSSYILLKPYFKEMKCAVL